MKARVIAMYLPQYHPVPENDAVWGKGFTEWTNVGRAKPLFKGHYQPRVPADLGYYDLRMPEAREAQAELAKEAGVEGFMYWHYWFGNGKQVLERPFNEVVATGSPDFPFCLGWANHSWRTDHWQDAKTRINKSPFIFEQLYPGKEDDIAHFNAFLPAFKDKRYIKVDGKLLFVIWDPLAIPHLKEFIKTWNELAIANGLNGFHFVGMAGGSIEKQKTVFKSGCDAINTSNAWIAESMVKGELWRILLTKLGKYFPKITPLSKFEYKKIIKYLISDVDREENVYPTIIPNWDRSPRSGRRAVIYTNSTPELFKQHVKDALNAVRDKEDEHKIIFLRSWNEWAEGNYMEPDLVFGHGYIKALREALEDK